MPLFKKRSRTTDTSDSSLVDKAPIRVECNITSLLDKVKDAFLSNEARPPSPDGLDTELDFADDMSALSDLTPLPSEDEYALSDNNGLLDDLTDGPSLKRYKGDRSSVNRPKSTKRPISVRVLAPFPASTDSRIIEVDAGPLPSTSTAPTPSSRSVSSTTDTPTRSQQKGRRKKSAAQVHARNVQKQENRRLGREASLREHDGVKEVSRKRRMEDAPKQLPGFDASTLPAAKGAWVGKKQYVKPEKRDLDSCLAAGIQVVPWEGETTHPVLDSEDRMFMLLGAKPRRSTWKNIIERAGRRVAKARKHIPFTKKQRIHCRGPFPVAASGINHGGGTEGPCNIANLPKTQRIMDDLLHSYEFRCIQGHADNIFKTSNPVMYKTYEDVLSFVESCDETLRRVYPNSPFAATTVNFGDQAVLRDHTDPHNAPFGWCRVTGMGNYNHRRGGHLVLWDLGLAFEFPPGATIFIPSAILLHSNLSIQQDETRYSVTSYSSGGLFRWAAHGGRTDDEYDEEFGKEVGRRERREHAETAWRNAMKYFPVWKPN